MDKVADMEVNKVADMSCSNLGRVGHKGWLIGPKLFRPEAYHPALGVCDACFFNDAIF